MQQSFCGEDELQRVTIQVVCSCLGRTTVGVEGKARLFTDLGADSLDVIDIVYQLERRMQVTFDGPERSFLAALNSIPPEAFVDENSIRTEWLLPWKDAFPGVELVMGSDVVLRTSLRDLITIDAFAELIRLKKAAEGR